MLPPGLGDAAAKWSSSDLEGFAGWLAEQPEEVVNRNATYVVNQLNGLERFDEAMDWAMATESNSARRGSVTNTLSAWSRRQPEEARAWLENAELSERDRKMYEGYLQRSR